MNQTIGELEEFFKSNSLKGINPLKWSAKVNFDGAQIHAWDCFHEIKTGTYLLTLEEIIALNPEEECLNYLRFSDAFGESFSAEYLLRELNKIVELPYWDTIKTITEPQDARRFVDCLSGIVKANSQEHFTKEITLINWMHHNRGYPLDANLIFETYNSQVDDIKDANLASVVSYILSYHSESSTILPLTQERLMADMIENNILEECSVIRMIDLEKFMESFMVDFDSKVIYSECRKLNQQSSRLMSLPHILAEAVSSWDLTVNTEKPIRLNWRPSQEDLLTATLLLDNGLDTQSALESAELLRVARI